MNAGAAGHAGYAAVTALPAAAAAPAAVCAPAGGGKGGKPSNSGGTFRMVLRAYNPGVVGGDGEQLPVAVGDRVIVYHHESRGWAYGSRLREDGTSIDGARGWFPAWVFESS